MNDFGELFNKEHEAFCKRPLSGEKIDVLVTFRLRAYGSEEQKQEEYKRDWPQFAEKGNCPAGLCISSDPIEIWVDMRKDGKFSKNIIHRAELAHEVLHAIRIEIARQTGLHLEENPEGDENPLLSPDHYTDI